MNPTLQKILAIFAIPYVAWLVFAYDYHFIDHVNLIFHEAGHLIFNWGETMHFLGGTLMQLLIPAVFGLYFLFRLEKFEAAVMLLWFGENLLNVARYMADAITMQLPLLGGGIHDWNWLFVHWGVLVKTDAIAQTTHGIGSGCVLLALLLIQRYAWEKA